MMTVLHNPDGTTTVVVTGDAAAGLAKSVETDPPPFPVVFMRPGAVYDPAARVIAPVYDAAAAAHVGELEQRAAHFERLAANLRGSVADRQAQLADERERVFGLRTRLVQAERELATAKVLRGGAGEPAPQVLQMPKVGRKKGK